MIENSQLAMQQAELGIQTLIEETEYLSLSMLIDPNIQELCREYKLDNTFISSAARQLYISMQDAVESKTYIDSVCVSYDGTILFQYGNKVLKETGSYQEQAGKWPAEVSGRRPRLWIIPSRRRAITSSHISGRLWISQNRMI